MHAVAMRIQLNNSTLIIAPIILLHYPTRPALIYKAKLNRRGFVMACTYDTRQLSYAPVFFFQNWDCDDGIINHDMWGLYGTVRGLEGHGTVVGAIS